MARAKHHKIVEVKRIGDDQYQTKLYPTDSGEQIELALAHFIKTIYDMNKHKDGFTLVAYMKKIEGWINQIEE